MSTQVEVYRDLRAAGIEERTAELLATVADQHAQLATRADLERVRLELLNAMAELKADLTWRVGATTVGALTALTAIFSAIVKFLP